jgi:hypothetical protein
MNCVFCGSASGVVPTTVNPTLPTVPVCANCSKIAAPPSARLVVKLREIMASAAAMGYIKPPSWAVMTSTLNKAGHRTPTGLPWLPNNLYVAAHKAGFDRETEWETLVPREPEGALTAPPPPGRAAGNRDPGLENPEAYNRWIESKKRVAARGMWPTAEEQARYRAEREAAELRSMTYEQACHLPGAEKMDSLANRMMRAGMDRVSEPESSRVNPWDKRPLAENSLDSPDAAPAQHDMIAMEEPTFIDITEEDDNGR